MRLSIKVLVILASIWALISTFTYIYSKQRLANEYARLEKQFVVEDLKQTTKTLYSIMSAVKLLNTDWASWDDAYNFMKSKNESFIQSNMQTVTFQNAKLSLILFFKPNGELFYGRNYNKQEDSFSSIEPSVLKKLQAENNLIHPPKDGSQGIIRTGKDYMVISAMPILTSEGKGPTSGTLLMAYRFDDQQIKRLADIVNMQVTFFAIPTPSNDTYLNAAHRQFLNGENYYVATAGENLIYGFAPVRNIQDQLIGILRTSSHREVYNAGISTINSYLSIILGMGVLLMITMWLLLKHFILDRITQTSKQIAHINQQGTFNENIKIKGNDELTTMVTGFNHLLEIISLTHEQLQRRVSLRTEELKRLSELNKDLFNEMNDQKNTETQLREQEKILRQMAYYDTLTGLPNRMYFQELLEKSISNSERSGASFAILFLDADDFKRINDTYGHDAGDKYLAKVATTLKSSIKECDVAARLGGDEFIVLLSGVRARPLIQKAVEHILASISKPMNVDNNELVCQFSAGISIYPEDGLTVEEMEKHSDFAMYYAKRQTNQAYAFYSDVSQLSTIASQPEDPLTGSDSASKSSTPEEEIS